MKAIEILSGIFCIIVMAFIMYIGYTTYIHEGNHGEHYGNPSLAKQEKCWLYK